MEKSILFQNTGLIPIVAMTIQGVSIKETADPFGFWGTGFKYAVAILLRHGYSIVVFRGTKKYEFETRSEVVRAGVSVNIVTMNGVDLGFTDQQGKKWGLWQAYRELYCNAQDEGGTVTIDTGDHYGIEGLTRIFVTGADFVYEHEHNDGIILQKRVDYEDDEVSVSLSPSDILFYQGIRVYEETADLTWNVKRDQDLTEDRTISYISSYRDACAEFVAVATDKDFLTMALCASKQSWEQDFSYAYMNVEPSQEFIDFVLPYVSKAKHSCNYSAVELVKRITKTKIEDQPDAALTKVEQKMLEKAIDFCNALDMDVDKYPIRIMADLGNGVLGMAKDETIFLTKSIFQKGTKYVACGLVEEWTHLHHNCRDCSREMQTIFLEKIVSLGETILGEPI